METRVPIYKQHIANKLELRIGTQNAVKLAYRLACSAFNSLSEPCKYERIEATTTRSTQKTSKNARRIGKIIIIKQRQDNFVGKVRRQSGSLRLH